MFWFWIFQFLPNLDTLIFLLCRGFCIFHRDAWKHSIILTPHEQCTVPTNTWHSLYNHTKEPCRMVEIQYGEECEELDIERAN